MASIITPTRKKTEERFELNEDNILDQVYLSHVISDVECDTKILYDLVRNILIPNTIQSSPPPPLSKPEFLQLKLVSCQMIGTRSSKRCAHQATMSILQQLRCYSWDAKVMVTVGAFCLEYGNFVYLDRAVVPSATADVVGSSLRQLNQIQSRRESVNQVMTELVKYIGQEVLPHINQWADLSTLDYDEEDVPALTHALESIPLLVYWTIASIVASTANLVSPSSSYTLLEFKGKLTEADKRLANHLETCKTQTEHVGDSLRRRKIVENPKDIVDVLRALIMKPKTIKTGSQPQIHEGMEQVKEGVEIFKGKCVLLFISILDRIEDEIRLMNSIYEGLKANKDPKAKGVYKKDEFKILWIPMVPEWGQGSIERFKNLKKSCNIRWYSVEYFLGELPGRKIIEEYFVHPYDFNLHKRPIIPVLDTDGKKINENALDLIFQWGIDAFPFRKDDGSENDKKWNWLWDAIQKANPAIEPQREKYTFIYGGGSENWVQNFTSEVRNLQNNNDVKAYDVEIDYQELAPKGRSSSSDVHSFWVSVERKCQKSKQHKDGDDLNCQIQSIARSLLCLKRDPQGWVIFTKGRNIKRFAHGEAMLQTLSQFQNWKDKVLVKEGFDIPLIEYYGNKVSEISDRQQPCSSITNSSNVIATITCPNPTCGRVMEVTSVNYKCCHRDDPNYCGY